MDFMIFVTLRFSLLRPIGLNRRSLKGDFFHVLIYSFPLMLLGKL